MPIPSRIRRPLPVLLACRTRKIAYGGRALGARYRAVVSDAGRVQDEERAYRVLEVQADLKEHIRIRECGRAERAERVDPGYSQRRQLGGKLNRLGGNRRWKRGRGRLDQGLGVDRIARRNRHPDVAGGWLLELFCAVLVVPRVRRSIRLYGSHVVQRDRYLAGLFRAGCPYGRTAGCGEQGNSERTKGFLD